MLNTHSNVAKFGLIIVSWALSQLPKINYAVDVNYLISLLMCSLFTKSPDLCPCGQVRWPLDAGVFLFLWQDAALAYSSNDRVRRARRTALRGYYHEPRTEQSAVQVLVIWTLVHYFHTCHTKEDLLLWFRFLFDNQSPNHIYYRWKLYSILHVWNLLDFMHSSMPIANIGNETLTM